MAIKTDTISEYTAETGVTVDGVVLKDGRVTETIKKYVALLTQSGTNAPTAVVLENSLGGTVVWSRVIDGEYLGTLTGAFPANKVWFGNQILKILTVNGFGYIERVSNNVVTIVTGMSDQELLNTSIEIRVYP